MRRRLLLEDFHKNPALPDAVGEDWEILNGPRPFPAHVTWTGDFLSGIFYGAIDPNDDDAELYRQGAADLDISELVFVSRDEVMEWAIEYCKQFSINPDDYDYTDLAKSYINHETR